MAIRYKNKDNLFNKLFNFQKRVFSAVRRTFFSKNLYFSQDGQDKYILEYFNNKKDGFFIDIGAYNGVTFSNTLKMEKLGWKGACIEPNPDMFKKVLKTRKCAKYNVAISKENGEILFNRIKGSCAVLSGIKEDYDPRHLERIENELKESGGEMETITVKTMSFDTLMEKFKNVKTIDYISIDTEGSELKILQSINFSKYNIKAISVENNYETNEIRDYMVKNGYQMITKLGLDEIYVKS